MTQSYQRHPQLEAARTVIVGLLGGEPPNARPDDFLCPGRCDGISDTNARVSEPTLC